MIDDLKHALGLGAAKPEPGRADLVPEGRFSLILALAIPSEATPSRSPLAARSSKSTRSAMTDPANTAPSRPDGRLCRICGRHRRRPTLTHQCRQTPQGHVTQLSEPTRNTATGT